MPLAKQVLTGEDRKRLESLGANGDETNKGRRRQYADSMENRRASAEDLLMMARRTDPPDPVKG